MKAMITLLFLWSLVLIYNTVYNFLPVDIQKIKLIKILAIVASLLILFIGIKQSIQKYQNYKFAYISAQDGKVLARKNFPWNITKTTTRDDKIVYIINERYGDASEIQVKPDKKINEYVIYNAMDGVGVKFLCPEEKIPNFRIIITK
jgi:hypothetical protein